MKKDLLSLPFDQYSRQYFVSEMIAAVKTVANKRHIKIVDIGGYKGKTAEFQNHDDVTVADLFEVNEKNYTQVPPDELPMKDGSFDVSVSFDAYEHVPRSNREHFVLEALRVSDDCFILAAPFDNSSGDTHKVEVIANDIYKGMAGLDHRWLKEHIEFRIPRNEELEEICGKNGISYFTMPTNDIATWLSLQAVFFTAELKTSPFPMVEAINRLYNSNLELFESEVTQGNSYRTIYCMCRDKKRTNAIKKEFQKTRSAKIDRHDESTIEVNIRLQQLIHQAYLLLAKD